MIDYRFVMLGAFFVLSAIAVYVLFTDPARVERKALQIRKQESEIGERILRGLLSMIEGTDFAIWSNHSEGDRGYFLILKHRTKDWPPPLLIVVDCSLPAEKQIEAGNAEDGYQFYQPTIQGLQDVMSLGVLYVDKATFSRFSRAPSPGAPS